MLQWILREGPPSIECLFVLIMSFQTIMLFITLQWTIYREFTNQNGLFSIAMLVYQRVSTCFSHIFGIVLNAGNPKTLFSIPLGFRHRDLRISRSSCTVTKLIVVHLAPDFSCTHVDTVGHFWHRNVSQGAGYIVTDSDIQDEVGTVPFGNAT